MADLPPTLEAVKGTRVGQIMKLHVKRGRVSTGAVLTSQTMKSCSFFYAHDSTLCRSSLPRVICLSLLFYLPLLLQLPLFLKLLEVVLNIWSFILDQVEKEHIFIQILEWEIYTHYLMDMIIHPYKTLELKETLQFLGSSFSQSLLTVTCIFPMPGTKVSTMEREEACIISPFWGTWDCKESDTTEQLCTPSYIS